MNTDTNTARGIGAHGAAHHLVDRAGASVSALEPQAFADAMSEDDALVIDVREADERVHDGTIPGAVHIPRGLLEFAADPADDHHDPRLRLPRRLLVHCADGSRSALAAETLHRLGHSEVVHLAGGLRAWTAEGRPVTRMYASPY